MQIHTERDFPFASSLPKYLQQTDAPGPGQKLGTQNSVSPSWWQGLRSQTVYCQKSRTGGGIETQTKALRDPKQHPNCLTKYPP